MSNLGASQNLEDVLLAQGAINAEQQAQIKKEQTSRGISAEQIIAEKGWVSETDMIKAKATAYNIPFVDLGQLTIPTEILTLLDADTATTYGAVPFEVVDNVVKVAMKDPLDLQAVQFIQTKVRKEVRAHFAGPDEIQRILDTKYGGQIQSEVSEAVEEAEGGVEEITEEIDKAEQLDQSIQNAPVARIVNRILEFAAKFGASDVHIEPREHDIRVRFRISGVLVERLNLPVKLGRTLVARIKILSKLKIDEHRVPQDGRYQIKVAGKEFDLRVSIMPTVYGEKVVIRLLEKGGGIRKLEETGLRGPAFKTYVEELKKTQGIILITGPTGSGKTQTLASSLIRINKPEVNIMTLEDPVEIKIEGITQVQVNADVGLTFAKGLRSFLRQDPDIIMVGEIRDSETARLATQAALTGHLVFATLHTNSAAGALPRMLDMGVESYLIASTVNLVAAQRLPRTLCEYCKEAYEAPPEVVKDIHMVLAGLQGFDMYSYPKRDNPGTVPGPAQASPVDTSQVPPAEVQRQAAVNVQQQNKVVLYRGKGCDRCNNAGYKGRTGIFEVFRVTERIGQMILENRAAGTLEKVAREEGMITMMQDGYMKALEGITTIEEVLRVCK